MTTDTSDIIRGPWVAVLSGDGGFVLDINSGADDLDDHYDVAVQVVRGSAAPTERDGGLRMPGTWYTADVLYRLDNFDDDDEVRRAWERAKAAAAALNASGVLGEVAAERARQDAKWGEQNHPDGTGRDGDAEMARLDRAKCKANVPDEDNWRDILQEEVSEAFAETNPALLRAELIQVAAVATQWVEAIDRRTAATGVDR